MDALGAQQLDRRRECFARLLERGDHDGVERTETFQVGGQPGGVGARGRDAGDLDEVVARDQTSDFREVAAADQGEPALSARRQHLEQLVALHPRLAKEGEQIHQIGRGQPRLFGHAARRQIIGVAPGRHLPDLDETLAEASIEIGVDQPERDAELARDRALRHGRIALDRIQHAEHDGVVGRLAPRDPHLGSWQPPPTDRPAAITAADVHAANTNATWNPYRVRGVNVNPKSAAKPPVWLRPRLLPCGRGPTAGSGRDW